MDIFAVPLDSKDGRFDHKRNPVKFHMSYSWSVVGLE